MHLHHQLVCNQLLQLVRAAEDIYIIFLQDKLIYVFSFGRAVKPFEVLEVCIPLNKLLHSRNP